MFGADKLRPVDETQEVAVVEVTEAVHFVYRRHRISDTRPDLRRQFEAEINSTARNSAARSPQNDRRVARLSKPGLSVATRRIAARVSGAATGCAMGRKTHLPLRACSSDRTSSVSS
jgi:hypothetical protein